MPVTDTDRCPELHNPGTWPYVARCVLDSAHEAHRDAQGREWTTPPSDSCTCRHCGQVIERDEANGWVHTEDGVVGCGAPLRESETYAEPA